MFAVVLLIVLLVSFCFLAFGIGLKSTVPRRKRLSFILATLSLLTAILLFIGYQAEILDFTQSQKTTTTKTEQTQEEEKEQKTPQPVREEPQKPEPTDEVEQPPNGETIEEDPPVVTPEKPQPTPTPPPVVSTPVPENETIEYKVIQGDTLWGISRRFNVTVSDLKYWNNLTSDEIHVGQILKLFGKNVKPPQPTPNPNPPTAETSIFITSGSTQKKQIALTFDAGSDIAGITIIDVLKKHNVKATFFLTGKWVEKFPAYAKRIVNEGHDIGNHTYSHPDVKTVSANAFIDNIKKAENIIISTTGKSPLPYFRFPYGSYNNEALKTVGKAGYRYSIQWSLDTIDWQQPKEEVIISRILTGASNGDIILMHIGGINTPQAVDQVIPQLRQRGFELVPLSVLLN